MDNGHQQGACVKCGIRKGVHQVTTIYKKRKPRAGGGSTTRQPVFISHFYWSVLAASLSDKLFKWCQGTVNECAVVY